MLFAPCSTRCAPACRRPGPPAAAGGGGRRGGALCAQDAAPPRAPVSRPVWDGHRRGTVESSLAALIRRPRLRPRGGDNERAAPSPSCLCWPTKPGPLPLPTQLAGGASRGGGARGADSRPRFLGSQAHCARLPVAQREKTRPAARGGRRLWAERAARRPAQQARAAAGACNAARVQHNAWQAQGSL